MRMLGPANVETGLKSYLFRYGLAVLLYLGVLVVSVLLAYVSANNNLTIPIVFAVVATAWYGGRGPGLLISVLLQATTILFAPLPPGTSPLKAWFGYFSIFALYVFLVLVISGLRKIQERLAAQRDLLHVTLSSIGDAVITTDTNGRVTFMNPAAQHLTGWHGRAAQGVPLDEVVRIVDEDTRLPAPNPAARVLETGSLAGLSNHSVLVAKDGGEIPIDKTAAPITDNGEVKGVVLVISDVTERKLAEKSRREVEIMHRLVEAQESERHRIARDLHDHLGQKMTALRFNIESLSEKRLDSRSLDRAIDIVQESAHNIDRDIGFLSWELRPTELDELGLENALSTFVREWSDQYGIAADFHADLDASRNGQGRLSEAFETNIYRITQEALNNILKHANATNVSVLLHDRGDHVQLIVEDNGVGFDPLPGDNGRHGGLGLIGMQERAALLKGTLDIDSTAGSGTAILVRIPVS